MTLVEPITSGRPTSGEAPFGADEIFYSRTDDRGIIRSGNEVFRRVADFSWEQLLGAPHRLIRHPDMPRAVFWLLWDRIKAGKATGAYVKNKARDGLHYWVYAIVTPVDGGYLSVRIKPSSSIFERTREIYDQALAREKDGMGPAESAAQMLDDLHRGAFASYDEFMGVALAQEIAARNAALSRPRASRVAHVAEIHSLLRDALRQKQNLLKAFDEIRAIPTNLHIVASRLEVYGGPVSTIAENYRLMSAEVTRRLQEVAGNGDGTAIGDRMQAAVSVGLFHIGSTLIFSETQTACQGQSCGTGIDAEVESQYLQTLDLLFRNRAQMGLLEVSRTSLQLAQTCEELKRLMLGLDSIRVLCRVEAGRMYSGGEGLQAIIKTLDRFHADVAERLDKILDLARRIRLASEAASKVNG